MDFYPPFVPVNIARGILITASGWDTPPSDLSNATDGDVNTKTGTGSTTKSGAGAYGAVVLDFGADKNSSNNIFIIGGKFGMWCTAGNSILKMDCSDDGVNFGELVPMGPAVPEVTEHIVISYGAVGMGRYARFFGIASAPATSYMNVYEIMAYRLAL